MPQNLISQTMTNAQRDAMLADLTAFDTKFTAYKVDLTPEDIAHLAKISEADMSVLQLALSFAQANAGTIPGNIPVAELATDLALAGQFSSVKAMTQQKADMVATSQIAALSDAYKTALLIYNVVKAQGRTPQNQTFLDEFGARFARGPQTPPAPPNP